MGRLKKVGIAISIAFIAIQFIQPAHNSSGQVLAIDFLNLYNAPKSVNNIVYHACYDCHSNNTNYPWYSNIQPIAWMMENHIKKGKEVLNFSEFGNYTSRKQNSKLQSVMNSIKDGTMPISSYKLMHKEAQLSKNEKEIVINWIRQLNDSLASQN